MKPIALAIPAMLMLGMNADAEESHDVRGLFCRTEAQIVEAFDYIRSGLGPRAAAELVNVDDVACVFADRIDYVVTRPFIISEVRHQGLSLIVYEATLTGVRVGANLRSIEDTLPIFFIQPDRIEGAITLGRA